MTDRQGSPSNLTLFEPAVPDGFQYRDGFVSADEESVLLEEIRQVEFSDFTLRGVVARRRVAFFGMSYDDGKPARPIPVFLLPLRTATAGWAGVSAEAFVMALINEYPPGAPIGWHRDAPQYGIIAGTSLLSSCRMRFRPYVEPRKTDRHRRATHEITLLPRSTYLITGRSRQDYEHSIPAVTTLRYSITFRTLRTPHQRT
jgi:alkylated DNA repair dioxygenase AlkB